MKDTVLTKKIIKYELSTSDIVHNYLMNVENLILTKSDKLKEEFKEFEYTVSLLGNGSAQDIKMAHILLK